MLNDPEVQAIDALASTIKTLREILDQLSEDGRDRITNYAASRLSYEIPELYHGWVPE